MHGTRRRMSCQPRLHLFAHVLAPLVFFIMSLTINMVHPAAAGAYTCKDETITDDKTIQSEHSIDISGCTFSGALTINIPGGGSSSVIIIIDATEFQRPVKISGTQHTTKDVHLSWTNVLAKQAVHITNVHFSSSSDSDSAEIRSSTFVSSLQLDTATIAASSRLTLVDSIVSVITFGPDITVEESSVLRFSNVSASAVMLSKMTVESGSRVESNDVRVSSRGFSVDRSTFVGASLSFVSCELNAVHSDSNVNALRLYFTTFTMMSQLVIEDSKVYVRYPQYTKALRFHSGSYLTNSSKVVARRSQFHGAVWVYAWMRSTVDMDAPSYGGIDMHVEGDDESLVTISLPSAIRVRGLVLRKCTAVPTHNVLHIGVEEKLQLPNLRFDNGSLVVEQIPSASVLRTLTLSGASFNGDSSLVVRSLAVADSITFVRMNFSRSSTLHISNVTASAVLIDSARVEGGSKVEIDSIQEVRSVTVASTIFESSSSFTVSNTSLAGRISSSVVPLLLRDTKFNAATLCLQNVTIQHACRGAIQLLATRENYLAFSNVSTMVIDGCRVHCNDVRYASAALFTNRIARVAFIGGTGENTATPGAGGEVAQGTTVIFRNSSVEGGRCLLYLKGAETSVILDAATLARTVVEIMGDSTSADTELDRVYVFLPPTVFSAKALTLHGVRVRWASELKLKYGIGDIPSQPPKVRVHHRIMVHGLLQLKRPLLLELRDGETLTIDGSSLSPHPNSNPDILINGVVLRNQSNLIVTSIPANYLLLREIVATGQSMVILNKVSVTLRGFALEQCTFNESSKMVVENSDFTQSSPSHNSFYVYNSRFSGNGTVLYLVQSTLRNSGSSGGTGLKIDGVSSHLEDGALMAVQSVPINVGTDAVRSSWKTQVGNAAIRLEGITYQRSRKVRFVLNASHVMFGSSVRNPTLSIQNVQGNNIVDSSIYCTENSAQVCTSASGGPAQHLPTSSAEGAAMLNWARDLSNDCRTQMAALVLETSNPAPTAIPISSSEEEELLFEEIADQLRCVPSLVQFRNLTARLLAADDDQTQPRATSTHSHTVKNELPATETITPLRIPTTTPAATITAPIPDETLTRETSVSKSMSPTWADELQTAPTTSPPAVTDDAQPTEAPTTPSPTPQPATTPSPSPITVVKQKKKQVATSVLIPQSEETATVVLSTAGASTAVASTLGSGGAGAIVVAGSSLRVMECGLAEDDPRPADFELPIQFPLGSGQLRYFTGAVLGHTILHCLLFLAPILLRRGLVHRTQRLKVKSKLLTVISMVFCGAHAFFTPAILGACSTVLNNDDDGLSLAVAGGCALVVIAIHVLTIVAVHFGPRNGIVTRTLRPLGGFNVKFEFAVRSSSTSTSSEKESESQSKSTESQSDDSSEHNSSKHIRGEQQLQQPVALLLSGESTKDILATLFDGCREYTKFTHRHYASIETTLFSIIAVISGARPEQNCGGAAFAIGGVALLQLLYIVVVRPYRTVLDTVFSTLNALVLVALSISVIVAIQSTTNNDPGPSWTLKMMEGCLWLISVMGFVQLGVQGYWAYHVAQRRKERERQNGEYDRSSSDDNGDDGSKSSRSSSSDDDGGSGTSHVVSVGASSRKRSGSSSLSRPLLTVAEQEGVYNNNLSNEIEDDEEEEEAGDDDHVNNPLGKDNGF